MAHSNRTYNSLDNALLPAILLSMGLHVIAAAFLHPFQVHVDRVLPPLEVVLQPPKPEPTPPPPEPPKSEPPKPQPKKMLSPPVKMPLPHPLEEHAIVPPTATPPPQVIATAPVTDVEPVFVAPTTSSPTQESEKPRGAASVDIDADLGKYGSMLAREYAKHKQYPRIAQMRGWQGKPKLEIHIDSNGNIISINIKNPSEYEVLDKSALETARKVSPLPPIPESLRGKEFTIIVPFDFKLE